MVGQHTLGTEAEKEGAKSTSSCTMEAIFISDSKEEVDRSRKWFLPAMRIVTSIPPTPVATEYRQILQSQSKAPKRNTGIDSESSERQRTCTTITTAFWNSMETDKNFLLKLGA